MPPSHHHLGVNLGVSISALAPLSVPAGAYTTRLELRDLEFCRLPAVWLWARLGLPIV
jgi:hypothetical protein